MPNTQDNELYTKQNQCSYNARQCHNKCKSRVNIQGSCSKNVLLRFSLSYENVISLSMLNMFSLGLMNI